MITELGTVKYKVVVVTGDVRNAGTDANVHINIYGTYGDTGSRQLTKRFRDLFERGRTDDFELEAVDLGMLYTIKVNLCFFII